jgi:type I restriction enzyme S subunit
MTTMADNKDKKVLNVPHLRFPEFSGEWEKYTIGDLCEEFKSGKNIKAESIQEEGVYPVFGGNGLRGYTDRYNHDGDYVLIGRQGALCGNVRFVTGKTYITEHAIAAKATNDNYTRYLEYLFVRLNLGQFSDQSAQPGLAVNKLLKIETYVPSKAEQLKIAFLLRLLDERIATQNKIIEDLKKLKSAIAETVFNNMQGHLTSLSAICNIVKGKQVNGEELSEKGKYYVMNGGITPSGYYDQCNTPANTISVSEGGNSCGYVQYNKSSFWSGGHCYTLQDITSGVDTQYLFHYLKRYESNIMNLRIGTGLPNIQKKDLENFRIALPPSNVQKEISTCLTAIEDKIMVEVKWLDSTQKEKLYLLRQMFI